MMLPYEPEGPITLRERTAVCCPLRVAMAPSNATVIHTSHIL